MDRTLIKSYTAAAPVTARRVVRFDTSTPFPNVVQAAAATEAQIGISSNDGENGTLLTPAGQRVDVILDGICEAEAGAAFAAGVLLSADAQGRVVTTTAAAGANARFIAVALQPAAAAGDIVQVYLQQGSFQG